MTARLAVLHRLHFMAMELCWIVGLLLLLDGHLGREGGPDLAYAAAFYPLALAAGLALRPLVRRPAMAAAVGAVLGLAAVAAAAAGSLPFDRMHADILVRGWLAVRTPGPFAAGLAVIVCAVLAWARGWMLSRRHIDAAGFASGFQNGLVILLVLLMLSAGSPAFGTATGVLVAVFLALGLLGLWHLRAAADAGRRGIATALLGIGAVLLLGAAFWLLIDRSLLESALAALRWFAGRIGQLFAWFSASMPASDAPAPPVQALHRGPPTEPPFDLPEALREVARIAFVILFWGFCSIALFRGLFDLLRWLRRRQAGVSVVYSRSAAGWTDTLRDLADWLRRRFRWPRGRGGGASDPVRSAYAEFLSRLGRRGWPRAPAETPGRLLVRLRAIWPGDASALAELTSTYMTVRYGPPSEGHRVPGAVLRRVRADLRKVRRSL